MKRLGGILITHKYGIFQSSGASCMFYKEDEDGNQSTFNLFTKTENDKKRLLSAYIDNEQLGSDNWFINKDITIKDAIEAFNKWASDAPIVFEMEAHKSIDNCLHSVMKFED